MRSTADLPPGGDRAQERRREADDGREHKDPRASPRQTTAQKKRIHQKYALTTERESVKRRPSISVQSSGTSSRIEEQCAIVLSVSGFNIHVVPPKETSIDIGAEKAAATIEDRSIERVYCEKYWMLEVF
jgi:hypothetical protein